MGVRDNLRSIVLYQQISQDIAKAPDLRFLSNRGLRCSVEDSLYIRLCDIMVHPTFPLSVRKAGGGAETPASYAVIGFSFRLLR